MKERKKEDRRKEKMMEAVVLVADAQPYHGFQKFSRHGMTRRKESEEGEREIPSSSSTVKKEG